MLRQDQETASEAAAQVRVTPEELAAAVTALQIRKEGQPGTIAIGDAVEELGLDVTPEEVLAEVQARRKPKPKRRRDYWALVCAIACAVPLVLGAFSHSPKRSNASAMSVPEVVQARTLDGVADGKEVYVDAHGLAQLFQKVPPTQIIVHHAEADYLWGIIKHHDKLYLIGLAASMPESQLKQNHVTLYSGPPDGYLMETGQGQTNYTDVTLPLETMRLEDTQMDEYAEKIVVSGVHPDGYLWE